MEKYYHIIFRKARFFEKKLKLYYENCRKRKKNCKNSRRILFSVIEKNGNAGENIKNCIFIKYVSKKLK